MGKSMSYVTCKVNMMTGSYTHVVMNKFTHFRVGTMCAVKGIAQCVREEILFGGIGSILSAAAAAAWGDNGTGGRLQDEYYCHCLQAIADKVLAVTIDWYLWQRGERLDGADLLGEHHRVVTTFY